MKQYILIIAALILLLVTGSQCNIGNKDCTLTSTDSTQIVRMYLANNPENQKLIINEYMEPHNQLEFYSGMTERTPIDTANPWIRSYNNLNKKPTGFLIYSDSLKHIINLNSKYVHVLFAYVHNNRDSLTLVIAGVDQDGKHMYISNADKRTRYALQHVMPCPPCIDLITGKLVRVHDTLEKPE